MRPSIKPTISSCTTKSVDTTVNVLGVDSCYVNNINRLFFRLKEYTKLSNQCGQFLRSRHLQYMLAFSFWPSIELKTGSNIYEIRSYNLEPGTMIEWGNNWARAINHRRSNDEPFAGFFSQVGRLYNVHHFWCK